MFDGTRRDELPPDWIALRAMVFARDRNRCQLRWRGCTTQAREVDHIDSRDDHRLSNLRSVCQSCHRRRTGHQGVDARARRRALRKRPPEQHAHRA